jgi:hypothetical protein
MDNEQRRAILVLGMHRSGTSVLARLVNLLGATLPTDLYPPDAQNPTGYWESQYLVGLNEWVLESASANWPNCLGFRPETVTWPTLVAVMRSLTEGIRRVFGEASFFVMKDPRLSLLLDFWVPALRSEGVEVSALITLRHPLAVARSLSMRNGFPVAQGVALWLRYMLAAEAGTRGLQRCVVAYEDLLTDWRGTVARAGREVGLTWPRTDVVEEVDAFLQPDLRHHKAARMEADVVPWQIQSWADESYAVLQTLRPDGQALSALDRVRGYFSGWCRAATGM